MESKPNKTNTAEHMEKMRQMSQESRAKEKALKKENFLVALVTKECAGNVSLASEKSGVTRSYMYELKAEDPDFALKWDAAVEEGYKTLKDLAIKGLLYHLEQQDKYIIMFVLKQLDPKTWNKDREAVGDGGGPIQYVHKMSPRFAKIAEALLAQQNGK